MIFPHNQNWRTTSLPFSLALKNTVNTGVSFDTPSRATANSQRWASAGFRGLGPVLTFPGGAGMDGLGCGCGCGGGCSGEGMSPLLWLAAGAAAVYFLAGRERSF